MQMYRNRYWNTNTIHIVRAAGGTTYLHQTGTNLLDPMELEASLRPLPYYTVHILFVVGTYYNACSEQQNSQN